MEQMKNANVTKKGVFKSTFHLLSALTNKYPNPISFMELKKSVPFTNQQVYTYFEHIILSRKKRDKKYQ